MKISFVPGGKFIEKDGRDWSRFYLPRGHPYLWSRARRVRQPKPRVYNMIREELALVKQNGARKPRRKKGWSGLFYPPNGLNFQFCWFNLIFRIAPSWSESNFILFYFFIRSGLVRVDPSWSDPDWRSELIRSETCTCLISDGIDGIVFVFHLAGCVRELWRLKRSLPYLIAVRSCISKYGKPE